MTDERDMRAAEYVLGSQPIEEREAVRRDMARDPILREAVARWEERLAPLAQNAPAVAPSPDLRARIKAGLPPRAANDDIESLRDAVRRWRNMAVLMGGLAAGLAIFVGVRGWGDAQKPQGTYVAAVNRGGAAPALIVRVDLASGRVFVRPVAAETPEGKSLELWYIGQGGAPKSLGLVRGPENLALPAGAPLDKAKFAVTVEPSGGSPTGGPTGPVVYAGELVRE